MLGKIATKNLITILGIIFIVSGLIAGVIFFTQYGISGFNPDDLVTYENNVDVEKEATLQGINTICIETTSHDIKLISADSDDVKAHFYGGYSISNNSYKPELAVTRNGDKLLIKIENTLNGMILSFRHDLQLDVYIPSKYSESVEVKTSSGKLIAGELSLEIFSVGTSSGDIKTGTVSAEKALIDTNSGKINFNGRFTELNVKSTSGDITSDTIEAENAKLESGSGAIRFSGKFSEVNVVSTSGDIASDSLEAAVSEFKSNSGKITLSGALTKITAKTTSGDILLSSSHNPQIVQITTGSGKTELKLPASAGFELNCQSNSGEVYSDFPVTVTTSGNRNKHDLSGTVGDGSGSVAISSTSGDIRIVK